MWVAPRAMDKLYPTRAQRRHRNKVCHAPSNPSRFLNEIPHELLEESKTKLGAREPLRITFDRVWLNQSQSKTLLTKLCQLLQSKSGNFQTGDKLKHPTFGTV